jgi:hypothetical protein
MDGYIWALDTPYAAVTGADGTFEIRNIPAGDELQLVVWHEGLPAPGFLGTGQGQKIVLNAGENDWPTIRLK